MKMFDFSNQVALITGASGDIGAACAKLLHSLGAHVIISGTNLTKLEDLGKELRNDYTIKQFDLHNVDSCEELINVSDKLDIVVCNAGITQDNLSLRMSLKSFQEVISINLTSTFALNKLAIKKMIKERYGRIVNISSVVAFSGNIGQANYCASKAGLVGMTKSLAREVAKRNITINCVAPGFIETNMTNQIAGEYKENILQQIPVGHFGNPSDVAYTVAYLCNKQASYITGQTLHVNGGMLMF